MNSTGSIRFVPLVAVLTLADVTSAFETMMIFAALKQLIDVYGDPQQVGWLVTAYLLMGAASAAIASRLGDLFGRKRVLLAVLVLAAIGSAVSAMSTQLHWIIVGRAIQGISGAIVPLGMGLLRQHAEPQRVSLGIGFLLSASGVGATSGLLIGGVIVDHLGWRHIFTAGLALAIVAALAVYWVVPRSLAKRSGGVDVFGGMLFAPAVASIILSTSNVSSNPSARFVMFAAGALLLAGWARHEYRHPNPLIDVRLLMGPALLPNLCMAIYALSALQLTLVQMIFLQQPVATGVGLGLSATAAALVKMPAKTITMFVAPIAGKLAGTLGPRVVTVSGFLLATLGWSLLLISHDNVWVVGTIMALFCAMSATVTYCGLVSAVVLEAPEARTSEATGVLTVTRTVFHAIGAQGVMAVLGDNVSGHYPSEAAYLWLFGGIASLSLLGAATGWFLNRDKSISEGTQDAIAVISIEPQRAKSILR